MSVNISSWLCRTVGVDDVLFLFPPSTPSPPLVSRARPSGERRSGDYCQHSVDSAGMLALPIRLQHLPIIALMKYLTPCVLNIEPSLTKPRLRGLTGAAPREARANGIIQHRSPDTYLASTPNRSPSSPLWTAGTRARTQRVKYFT